MKLAHLILAHDNSTQLLRLVKRLSHPDADIYIHIDVKAHIDDFSAVKNIPNVFFVEKRVAVYWCEYSTVQATLNGIEQILITNKNYSHINLLSGNDYPLKSTTYIHSFLFANAGKTFMWYDLIFDDWHHGKARISQHYFGDYGFPGRYHLGVFLKKILPKRKMPEGLKAYGRAQWLTITPTAAAYVINYLREHHAERAFFRRTWAVDEILFQTILCNSPLIDTIVNNNLRYIVLNDEYRPVTFTMADAEALTTSDQLFARKFDINTDAAIFDYLDAFLTNFKKVKL